MTKRLNAQRSRLVRRPALVFMLGVLLALPLASLARADSSNLLPNGSFQSGTSGWAASDAAFTIASDGVDDSFAGQLALSTTATTYQLTAKPRPVLNTTAGIVYVANGFVRSDTPGKSVCLLLKEFTSAGTNVLTSNLCATASSNWVQFPQVTLIAMNSGDQIALLVKRSNAVAGESFEVDNLSLVASGGGGGGTAPSTPTSVSATPVSSSQIDLSWTASTDPDPDGVAGYTIYRDGGASPIATVSGSTTSYSDSAVAPGTTHTYTVSAFDAAGNSSPQSTPSNPATTPQSSVVGLWHLDEVNGPTAFDSSGLGNDGAISGPVTLGVPGQTNTAYSFVPKSVITVPDAPDLRPVTANITISYWLMATVPPPRADYDIFVKGSKATRSSSGEIKIELQPNGQASCGFWGGLGGKQLQMGPSNLFDGQWHQVTCQRTGNQIVETVDGVSFSVTKATGAITVTDSIRIGAHTGGGDWYRGVLDEVVYSIG